MSTSKILVMPLSTDTHPSDEALEFYFLRQLPDSDVKTVEEHLLICSECRTRLEETEEYVQAMRQALGEIESPRKAAPNSRSWMSWVTLAPRPAWAGALAVAALLFVALRFQPNPEPAYELDLATFRGDTTTVATAPADRNLVVRLDLTALPEADSYRVEVADSGGNALFSRVLARTGNTLSLDTGRSFDAGQHWIRVYMPGAGGELLREFGLRVD